MVKIFSKMGEAGIEIQEVEPLMSKDHGENDTAFILKKLKSEETCLTEEVQNLSTLKESLTTKVKAEIEVRRSRIQMLKSQITDIKGDCEALNESLSTSLPSQ